MFFILARSSNCASSCAGLSLKVVAIRSKCNLVSADIAVDARGPTLKAVNACQGKLKTRYGETPVNTPTKQLTNNLGLRGERLKELQEHTMLSVGTCMLPRRTQICCVKSSTQV